MATIIRGTSCTLELTIPGGLAVANIKNIRVDLSQGDLEIVKAMRDVMIDKEFNRMYLTLTSVETSSFSVGVVNVQIRYKLEGESAVRTTSIHPVKVKSSGTSQEGSGGHCPPRDPPPPKWGDMKPSRPLPPDVDCSPRPPKVIYSDDYNNLKNTPIKNLQGESDLSYINLSGLEEGHYMLSGYFKRYIGDRMRNAVNPVELWVFQGADSEEELTVLKVILYITMEFGEVYLNRMVYRNSVLSEKDKTCMTGQKWENIGQESFD